MKYFPKEVIQEECFILFSCLPKASKTESAGQNGSSLMPVILNCSKTQVSWEVSSMKIPQVLTGWYHHLHPYLEVKWFHGHRFTGTALQVHRLQLMPTSTPGNQSSLPNEALRQLPSTDQWALTTHSSILPRSQAAKFPVRADFSNFHHITPAPTSMEYVDHPLDHWTKTKRKICHYV